MQLMVALVRLIVPTVNFMSVQVEKQAQLACLMLTAMLETMQRWPKMALKRRVPQLLIALQTHQWVHPPVTQKTWSPLQESKGLERKSQKSKHGLSIRNPLWFTDSMGTLTMM